MDSDSSESNLVIITKRQRIKLFWKLHWRIIIFIITPLIFFPVLLVTESEACKSFYVFLITATYWTTDVFHPGIISLVSTALWIITGTTHYINYYQISIRNEILDTLSILIITLSIEKNGVNRRLAVKLLLIFGCSHYRLSFVLFFTSMFLSMWLSDIIGCGLMMPLVKAVLTELEKMGILEMYQTFGKNKRILALHDQKNLRPTNFTVFYFLGIAYSSSIGSLASITGSRSHQIFKHYCESLFPSSPAVEFPHIILMNLPGVLVMETFLYMYMNAYYLGMFRSHSNIAIEIGMTREEAEYTNTLLQTQYHQLGKLKFNEIAVTVTVVLACVLQITFSFLQTQYNSYMNISSPSLLCAVLLFVMPTNLDFIRFFQRQGQNNKPLPDSSSKSCLSWDLVQNQIDWSVLIVIENTVTYNMVTHGNWLPTSVVLKASTTATMEALKDSGMIMKLGRSLEDLSGWPAPVLVLVLILLCKFLTEFANNPCVAYCLLPTVARLSVATSVNPHYMMIAATISCSLPFHLISSSPVNAMVASYVHIPSWKMMSGGIGPSLITIAVTWLTVVVWSRAVWTDIQVQPHWATDHDLFHNNV